MSCMSQLLESLEKGPSELMRELAINQGSGCWCTVSIKCVCSSKQACKLPDLELLGLAHSACNAL